LVLAERGVSFQLIRGVVVYSGGYAVDADGDPRAYSLDGKGDDRLGNAGHDGDWFGVLTDTGKPTGKPIRQGTHDPFPGFLIPTTSLSDHSKPLTDPTRYLDSRVVRYISIPHELLHSPVNLGDVAIVCYQGRTCAAIVGDVGPRGKYGEGSIALAQALGFKNCSPKNGGVDSGCTTAIFPGTARAPAWPRTNEDVEKQAMLLFGTWNAMGTIAI